MPSREVVSLLSELSHSLLTVDGVDGVTRALRELADRSGGG